MPTYSYECVKCAHVFDIFHSMTKTPRVKCEKCRSKCQRLFGAGAGIIFKGSGFYETDYKQKKGEPPSEKKKDGAKDTEKKTGAKTKDKPEKAKADGAAKN